MKVEIKHILDPFGRECSTSKMIIIEDRIQILVGVAFRTFGNGQSLDGVLTVRSPNRHLYESSLVVTTDIMLREVNIVKNRYGSNFYNLTLDDFLNIKIPDLLRSLLSEYDYNRYDMYHIISTFATVLSSLTGESILNINGVYYHPRSYYSKKLLIQQKPLKHKFINA